MMYRDLISATSVFALAMLGAGQTAQAAVVLDSSSSNQLVQAEAFDLASGPVTPNTDPSGDILIATSTDYPGNSATNGSFLRNFDYNAQPSNPNGDGSASYDWVQHALTVNDAGFYNIDLSYNIGSASDNRQVELFIDAGGSLQSVAVWNMGAGGLVDTGDWNIDFATAAARNVALPAGNYNLRIQSGDGDVTNRGTNVDALGVSFDSVIPEPASLGLLGLGGLTLLRRRCA